MIALPSAVSASISCCCPAVGGDRSAAALPKPLVASQQVGDDLDPFPAFPAQGLGDLVELLRCQLVDQRGVDEPAP
jgi:hypothetical protein